MGELQASNGKKKLIFTQEKWETNRALHVPCVVLDMDGWNNSFFFLNTVSKCSVYLPKLDMIVLENHVQAFVPSTNIQSVLLSGHGFSDNKTKVPIRMLMLLFITCSTKNSKIIA